MTYLILIIIAIIIIIIFNAFKGGKDIQNVEKYGGLRYKYTELIGYLMSNEKLKLTVINSNNVEIGYNFVGNGYVRFKLIELSKTLQVAYQSKDNINGIQNLVWKFGELEDQKKMFDTISKDLYINNLMLGGLSREEAINEYFELTKNN